MIYFRRKNILIRTLQTIILVCAILMAISCKSDDALPNASIEIISGDNQTGVSGEYLLEPVAIKVSSKFQPNMLMVFGKEVDGFGQVFVEKLSSSFEIESRTPILNENYEARLFPSLGCETGEQTFEIQIRSTDCEFGEECTVLGSTTVKFTANANTSGWEKICGSRYLKDIKKHSDIFYATTSPLSLNTRSTLMKSTDYRKWELIYDFERPIYNFEVLANGDLIVLTSTGIFLSDDGVNWENTFVEVSTESGGLYDSEMLAEDSLILVSNVENEFDSKAKLYRTRNNGESWDEIDAPIFSYPIVRNANGNIYGFDTDLNVYFSSNSGNTWDQLSISGSITESIVSVTSAKANELLIVTNEQSISSEPMTITLSSTLYSLDLITGNLSEIEVEGYITDLKSFDSENYVLVSSGDIYKVDDMLQKISGPQKTYPDATGFFAFGFDALFINNPNQFLISGLQETYLNF